MINVNIQGKTPIYEQLYNYIVKMVSMEVMVPHEQLPPVRSLAKDLGVNPNTVQKAYQLLERDNIIYSVSGKGSYISDKENAETKKEHIAVLKLNNVLNELVNIGISQECVINIVKKFFNHHNLKCHKEEKKC